MVSANELRIGNYILISVLQEGGSFKNELFTVSSTTIRDAEHYGNEWNASPIPLTEEWLFKFGFKLMSNQYYSLGDLIIKNGKVLLSNDSPAYAYSLRNKIEYVHQLQNLYFALTENELEIK